MYTSYVAGLVLIARLLILRLHRVYTVFWVFVLWRLIAASIFVVEINVNWKLDYRIMWLIVELIDWCISLWMVYALLDAILANLPGILRFSRKLLNYTFAGAVLIAILSARPEHSASGGTSASLLNSAVALGVEIDRVVSTAAALVLVAVLSFVLWFPVRMPRNLALLSVGYLGFFCSNTLLLLTRGLWPAEYSGFPGTISILLMAACFAYWALCITPQGETVPVTIGHSWHLAKQDLLLRQLDAMNAALLRQARR
jgi:hypothetical protein